MIASHTFARPVHHRLALVGVSAGLVALGLAFAGAASAVAPPVPLGTADRYAVLAGAGVTNNPNRTTTISTDDPALTGAIGTSPNNTITGDGSISWVLPAAREIHLADAAALQAQLDNGIAYGVAASATSDAGLGAQLDNVVIKPGVSTASSALDLAVGGTVTLDAEGDSGAVFVIQVGSSLTLNSGSTVALTGGALACRVFWQVSDDATIGSDATFRGTMLAENAIVAQSRARIEGRLLAQDASVTLDENAFTLPSCGPAVTTPAPSTATPTPVPTTSAPATGGSTATPKPTPKPTKSSGSGTTPSDDDSDDGGSGGSTEGDASSGGLTSGGGGGDADGSSSSTSTGIPNAGGPPAFLAPAGAVAVLAGAVLMIASRRPRGAHRA